MVSVKFSSKKGGGIGNEIILQANPGIDGFGVGFIGRLF
jgi:hypothetical protein